jgi:hypothetical protein
VLALICEAFPPGPLEPRLYHADRITTL